MYFTLSFESLELSRVDKRFEKKCNSLEIISKVSLSYENPLSVTMISVDRSAREKLLIRCELFVSSSVVSTTSLSLSDHFKCSDT